MTDKTADPRTVKLKNVRVFYAEALHEAKPTVDGGPDKHTCTLVIESDTPEAEANNKAMKIGLAAASEQTWKKANAWEIIAENDPKRCAYRPGSKFRNKEGEIYKGFEGNQAISVAGPSGGKRRPVILDRRKNRVDVANIPDIVYGGVYADCIVSLYGTEKGGRGVFASIEVLRSREEGERMGGGFQYSESDADDLFDDLKDDDDLDAFG